jgi:hypothetical protein
MILPVKKGLYFLRPFFNPGAVIVVNRWLNFS